MKGFTWKEFMDNAVNEGEEKTARFSKNMKQLMYWTSKNTSTTVNCEDMKKAKAIIKNSGVKQKVITEGQINEAANIKDVADDMARLIMGDKNIALKNLNKSLPLKQATFQPGKEYNNAFTELRSDIQFAIGKALKAAK